MQQEERLDINFYREHSFVWYWSLVGFFWVQALHWVYTNYTNIVFSIPVWQIFGAVLLALLIGAISGVYPAIKASKIQPAEAVRK